MTTKEDVYDEKVSPLMAQIIAICKEAKINMAAQFSLDYDEGRDSPLYCTTVLQDVDPDDVHGVKRMTRLRAAMNPPAAPLVAFMITTKEPT